MLRNTPHENIELLKELKSKFRLFLLNNTDEIHVALYNRIFRNEFGLKGGLRELFEKTYYSHEVGYRKPSPEIFRYVLDDAGLIPGGNPVYRRFDTKHSTS